MVSPLERFKYSRQLSEVMCTRCVGLTKLKFLGTSLYWNLGPYFMFLLTRMAALVHGIVSVAFLIGNCVELHSSDAIA